MTQPRLADLAAMCEFWESARWVFLQNLNYFSNPKIILLHFASSEADFAFDSVPSPFVAAPSWTSLSLLSLLATLGTAFSEVNSHLSASFARDSRDLDVSTQGQFGH